MTELKISDFYDSKGRLIMVEQREKDMAGLSIEQIDEYYGDMVGLGTDDSAIDAGDLDRAEFQESKSQHSDVAELAVYRFLNSVLPDADIQGHCFEEGETAPCDIEVNGLKIDVKARLLFLGQEYSDLLVTVPHAQQSDADYYISVIVGHDADEIVIQGGADEQTVKNDFQFCKDLTGDGIKSYVVPGLLNSQHTVIDDPNRMLDRLADN